MRLNVVGHAQPVVVWGDEGQRPLLDGDVALVGFGLEVVHQHPLVGDEHEKVLHQGHLFDLEVGLQLVDFPLIDEICLVWPVPHRRTLLWETSAAMPVPYWSEAAWQVIPREDLSLKRGS